jgi:hypothetical protein
MLLAEVCGLRQWLTSRSREELTLPDSKGSTGESPGISVIGTTAWICPLKIAPIQQRRAWWGTWGPRRPHWHGSKRVCQAAQGSTPNLTSPYALRCSQPRLHHPDFIASPTQLRSGKITPHDVRHRHNNAARMGRRSQKPTSAQVETGRHSRPPRVPVVAIAVQLQGRDLALSAPDAGPSKGLLTQAPAEEGCQRPESRPAKGADARGDGHAEAEEGLGGGAGPD